MVENPKFQIAESKTAESGIFARILGTWFGRPAIVEDIKKNIPYSQASIVFGSVIFLNFLILCTALYFVYSIGGASASSFLSTIPLAVFALLLFGAVLWMAYSFLFYGISQIGKGTDINAQAAYCFSAYFYTIFTLFSVFFFLICIVVKINSLIANWYLVLVFLFLIASTILLFVSLYKFFRRCYFMSAGKSLFALLVYLICLLIIYLIVRAAYSYVSGAMIGEMVGGIVGA